jgi:hypothetical protein
LINLASSKLRTVSKEKEKKEHISVHEKHKTHKDSKETNKKNHPQSMVKKIIINFKKSKKF